ncbi:MAG TPA: hypothetical protein VGE51_11645 [Fontimonas sp.]
MSGPEAVRFVSQKQANSGIDDSPSDKTDHRTQRIVFADDHPTMRHMLQRILARLDNIEIAEANSFEALAQ